MVSFILFMNRSHRIAVIPGDGIGNEVISEGVNRIYLRKRSGQ